MNENTELYECAVSHWPVGWREGWGWKIAAVTHK